MNIPRFAAIIALSSIMALSARADNAPELRTPPTPHTPRINGPAIFGARPDHPCLYHIPATGDRPMQFSVDGLPAGLTVNSNTGDISGTLSNAGSHIVTFHAKNALGVDSKKFKIVIGETIALTPPMGWNSWNHYAGNVSAEVVLTNARAMVSSGLINYGWTYMNIDDTWQGKRGGTFMGLQGNDKFPDMKGLCDAVHGMGLKIGIYSTPWVTSYAGFAGGSSDNDDGSWQPSPGGQRGGHHIGKYSFANNDARQWAEWGMDYLKYDWNPNRPPETAEMHDALRRSGRDIIFSLSNSSPFTNAPTLSRLANCWRTTGDIKANWRSMSAKGFGQDKWLPYAGAGHWNDPDMLEIGTHERNQPGLTPNEEYTHMTIWCMDSAPLLLGNDLSQLDAFTLNILENNEVLAVNQDSLGEQGATLIDTGDTKVYLKNLADGSLAVGLFNLSTNDAVKVTVPFEKLGISGRHAVRDLWRQKDLGKFSGEFGMPVASHGAELVKIR